MDEQYYQFQVSGMSCEHCVGKVHDALTAVPGVNEFGVDLESGQARLRADDVALSETLANAISRLTMTNANRLRHMRIPI